MTEVDAIMSEGNVIMTDINAFMNAGFAAKNEENRGN